MSFRFRLQRLLELREQHEQARARELASAQHTAEQAAEARAAIEAVHRDSKGQIRIATESTSRVGHLHQLGSVMNSLETRLHDASDAVRSADASVVEAQRLLEAAARERKVLDRLKDRHADVWRADEAQKDRISMDEIALTRFTRQHDVATGDSMPASPDGSD